jgi:hypothetical protein
VAAHNNLLEYSTEGVGFAIPPHKMSTTVYIGK